MAENLKDVEPYNNNEIIRDFDKPIKEDSHLRILYGNLAQEGAVGPAQTTQTNPADGTSVGWSGQVDPPHWHFSYKTLPG